MCVIGISFLLFNVGFEAHCIKHTASGTHDKIQRPDVTHQQTVITPYCLSIKDDRYNQVKKTAIIAERPAADRIIQNDVITVLGDEHALPDKQHAVSDMDPKDAVKNES